MTVTLVIRRPAAADLTGKSRDEIGREISADPEDVEAVTNFAKARGLTVSDVSAAKRSVQVEGTPQQLNDIFGPGIPSELSGILIAALGLSQSPVAKPHT
jgi:hypothetical protein